MYEVKKQEGAILNNHTYHGVVNTFKQEGDLLLDMIIGSSISAFATALGALPILLFNRLSHKFRDMLLAFTAGIMVTACSFSLIPEALVKSNVWVVLTGLLIGTFVLDRMEKYIPHSHPERENLSYMPNLDKKTFLIVSALTLHNIPEGLSVGVSYAGDSGELGGIIAFAIGLQNAPEGLLVALYLVNQNMSKVKAFLFAALTGSIEIAAALLGYSLTNYIDDLIPYGLSFAAGAMLFIVYKELIPESHGDGNERYSTYAFIGGLGMMLAIISIFT